MKTTTVDRTFCAIGWLIAAAFRFSLPSLLYLVGSLAVALPWLQGHHVVLAVGIVAVVAIIGQVIFQITLAGLGEYNDVLSHEQRSSLRQLGYYELHVAWYTILRLLFPDVFVLIVVLFFAKKARKRAMHRISTPELEHELSAMGNSVPDHNTADGAHEDEQLSSNEETTALSAESEENSRSLAATMVAGDIATEREISVIDVDTEALTTQEDTGAVSALQQQLAQQKPRVISFVDQEPVIESPVDDLKRYEFPLNDPSGPSAYDADDEVSVGPADRQSRRQQRHKSGILLPIIAWTVVTLCSAFLYPSILGGIQFLIVLGLHAYVSWIVVTRQQTAQRLFKHDAMTCKTTRFFGLLSTAIAGIHSVVYYLFQVRKISWHSPSKYPSSSIFSKKPPAKTHRISPA